MSCDGTGYIIEPQGKAKYDKKYLNTQRVPCPGCPKCKSKCPECGGTGEEYPNANRMCLACEGKGMKEKSQEGERMRYLWLHKGIEGGEK